jgi:hypothetical protein
VDNAKSEQWSCRAPCGWTGGDLDAASRHMREHRDHTAYVSGYDEPCDEGCVFGPPHRRVLRFLSTAGMSEFRALRKRK